jgi:hypothetical protein
MHRSDSRAPRRETWLLLALLSLAPTLAAPNDPPCPQCLLHDGGPDGGADGGADAAPDAAAARPDAAAESGGGGGSDGCAVAPRDAAAALGPLLFLAAGWLPLRRRRR